MTPTSQSHVSGQTSRAEQAYLALLADNPGDRSAQYGLGLVYLQTGREVEAVEIFGHLVVEGEASAELQCNFGIALSLLDRHLEAVAALRLAARIDNSSPNIHFNLGNALQNADQHADAIAAYSEAVRLAPDNAFVYFNLANSYRKLGDDTSAVRHYRRALEIDPNYRKCLKNLAISLGRLGRHDESEVCLRQLIAHSTDVALKRLLAVSLMEQRKFSDASQVLYSAGPDSSDTFSQYLLALCLIEDGDTDEAIRMVQSTGPPTEECLPFSFALRESLSKSHRHAEAIGLAQRVVDAFQDDGSVYQDLGMALFGRLKFHDAITNYKKALQLGVASPDIFNNLGAACQALGEVEQGITYFDHALRIRPDFAPARLNRAFSFFQVGRFREAWHEMEWRRLSQQDEPPTDIQPLWHGNELPGGTVLLAAEQGIGDIIQFIRYARQVRDRCDRVILMCPSRLHAILSSCPYVDELRDERDAIPVHDAFAPLMSLPSILGIEKPSSFDAAPYLFPCDDLVRFWQQHLPFPDAFRIGVAWQGNPEYQSDGVRSVPLKYFEPIAKIAGVKLFSLQIGVGANQIDDVADRFRVHRIKPDIDATTGALMDTAAIMSNLDLILTSDTALPHLAGAMAVPVWVALSYSPDWRWFGKGTDTPWYPTMRLFRQRRLNDWRGCFEMIRDELATHADGEH